MNLQQISQLGRLAAMEKIAAKRPHAVNAAVDGGGIGDSPPIPRFAVNQQPTSKRDIAVLEARQDRSVDRGRRLHDLNVKPIEASGLPASVGNYLNSMNRDSLEDQSNIKMTMGGNELPQHANHLRPGHSENWWKNLLSGGAYNKAVREQRAVRDAAAYQTGGQLYSSTPSLGGQIAGYYENVPGGFQGAIGDAQQKMRERPIVTAVGGSYDASSQRHGKPSSGFGYSVDGRLSMYPKWKSEDLRRPIDNYFIPTSVIGGLPGTGGRVQGYQADGHIVSGTSPGNRWSPTDPSNVGSVPRSSANTGGIPTAVDELGQTTYVAPNQQNTVEHELTHAAYGGPLSSDPRSKGRGSYVGSNPYPDDPRVDDTAALAEEYFGLVDPNGVRQLQQSRDNWAEPARWDSYSAADQDYITQTTPTEMDPRLAEIKRSYAASTGRLVNNPKEAERAWKWWQNKIQKDPAFIGSWNPKHFERINADPVERAAALRRMQEIVKTDPQRGMPQREVVAHDKTSMGKAAQLGRLAAMTKVYS